LSCGEQATGSAAPSAAAVGVEQRQRARAAVLQRCGEDLAAAPAGGFGKGRVHGRTPSDEQSF
jgi:hypothetical protein